MRDCIADNCHHYKTRRGPDCALMGPKFKATSVMPQPFCPIISGNSNSAQFDYEKLARLEPGKKWQILAGLRRAGAIV